MATYSSYNTITLSIQDFSYPELQSIQRVFSYNPHHPLWQMAERFMEFVDSNHQEGQNSFPLSVRDVAELLNTVGGSNGIKLRPQVTQALQAVVDEANQRMQQKKMGDEPLPASPDKPSLLRTNGKTSSGLASSEMELLRLSTRAGEWAREVESGQSPDISHLPFSDQIILIGYIVESLAQDCIQQKKKPNTGILGTNWRAQETTVFDSRSFAHHLQTLLEPIVACDVDRANAIMGQIAAKLGNTSDHNLQAFADKAVTVAIQVTGRGFGDC